MGICYQQEQPVRNRNLLLVFHCQVIRYWDKRGMAKAEKQSKHKEDVSKDIALSDCNRSWNENCNHTDKSERVRISWDPLCCSIHNFLLSLRKSILVFPAISYKNSIWTALSLKTIYNPISINRGCFPNKDTLSSLLAFVPEGFPGPLFAVASAFDFLIVFDWNHLGFRTNNAANPPCEIFMHISFRCIWCILRCIPSAKFAFKSWFSFN